MLLAFLKKFHRQFWRNDLGFFGHFQIGLDSANAIGHHCDSYGREISRWDGYPGSSVVTEQPYGLGFAFAVRPEIRPTANANGIGSPGVVIGQLIAPGLVTP